MLLARFLATAILAGAAVGCGSREDAGPRETAYPVSGTVKVKGLPAFEARVRAVPAGAVPDGDRQFETLTDEKGEFRFGTNTATDGLPPGKYDIRISWPDIVRRSEPSREIDRLNGRYNVPNRPAFTIDVKDPNNNQLPPFDLR